MYRRELTFVEAFKSAGWKERILGVTMFLFAGGAVLFAIGYKLGHLAAFCRIGF
jgi:hypothetical protein